MLRRAAPLVRTLRSSTTVVQSSTSSSNGRSTVVNAGRGGYERNERRGGYGRNERRGGFERGGERNKFQQSHIVDEHTQLMKKHGDTIQNTEVHSLTDAIERINWHPSVTQRIVDKVCKMMLKASIEELNTISDRSMATLFSSFGEMCKEMKRDEKKKMIEGIIKTITAKGYILGPFTRTSIFTTKVDNYETMEELPSIVDELSTWESAGLTPTEDLIVQAARVYATQGDRKGVIELTNYARETFGRVEVRFLEWLSYSMISCGESNGMTAIEKLSRSAADSSTRLWLSGALAAANKTDLALTVECLSRVPLTARLTNYDQNGSIVEVLVQLIERGVDGAEQALSGYLTLTGDGSTLHERHASNPLVVFKARRAVKEEKMDVATRLYALAHDMHKNKFVETELRSGLLKMGSKGEKSVEEVKQCAMRLQQSGVIDDANGFLLGAFDGSRLIEFITHLRSTNELADAVYKCKHDHFPLAYKMIKSSSSPFSVATSVAAILCSSGGMSVDRPDVEKYIFKAAKDDPEVVLKVLEELAESNMADAESLGGHITTSALSRILLEKDVLTSGRIEKIIASPNIPSIRLSILENKIISLIRMAKDEETTKGVVDMVAGIISATFKTNSRRKDYEMITLIKIIGNPSICDDKMEMLVNILIRDPSVGIGQNFMEKAVRDLEQRGLKKRVELIGLLQKKSQASVRWMMSSPDVLEKELDGLEKQEGVHNGVLVSIKNILMEKLVDAKPVSTARLIPLLEKIIPTLKTETVLKEGNEKEPWEYARLTRLIQSTEKVYAKSMKQSVLEGDWSGATRLWAMRGDLRFIPIGPALALSYHDSKGASQELSRDILSTIRSNGQSVTPIDLTELGDLLSELSMDELSSVGEWLKKELRLEEILITRIKSARVKNTMGELIESGRLEEAFEVMKEASEKAKSAIGHFDLFRAALRNNKGQLIESIFNVVASLHSKAGASLDLAYAFLMEKRRELGEKLIRNPSLKFSFAKLDFYIKNAIQEDRVDVVHALFSILVSVPLSEEKLTNASLNHLASATLRAYVKNQDMESAKKVIDEIEGSSLVVEKPLFILIERVKKTSRSSSV